MPVDRVRRDAAAEALAAYLRGETPSHKTWSKLHALEADQRSTPTERDAAIQDAAEILSDYWFATPENMWRYQCRTLAFLCTDLESVPLEDYLASEEISTISATTRPHEIRLASWQLLALFVVFGIAYWTSWWILAPAIPISFYTYTRLMSKYYSQANAKWERDLNHRCQVHPFADEATWLAHQHILEAYQLPIYDEQTFTESSDSPTLFGRLEAVASSLLFALLAGCVVLLLAILSPIWWPIYLFRMACSPRADSRR